MSVMMPPSRLKTLLSQALERQQNKCLYHNSTEPPVLGSYSLLLDHACHRLVCLCGFGFLSFYCTHMSSAYKKLKVSYFLFLLKPINFWAGQARPSSQPVLKELVSLKWICLFWWK